MKFDITSTEKITHSSDIIILAIDDKNNLINGNGINEVDESLVKKSLKKYVLGKSEGDTNILNDSTASRQYLLVRVTDLQSINIKEWVRFSIRCLHIYQNYPLRQFKCVCVNLLEPKLEWKRLLNYMSEPLCIIFIISMQLKVKKLVKLLSRISFT